MNLIESMMEPVTIMNKTTTSDGEGGYTTSWADGAQIQAAIVMDSSTLSKIAETAGVTSKYTVTTKKSVTLDFHDVIKRNSDGHIFRVTSNANEKESPEVSTLDIAQVSAEKWSLT